MATHNITEVREILSDLNYTSYSTNRTLAPEISSERWAALYNFPPDVAASFELRYQAELHQSDPRCEGYESMFGTGENDIPCLARTVKCPVCGEESGLCAKHLWQCDHCGKSMCVECAEAAGWSCQGCVQRELHGWNEAVAS